MFLQADQRKGGAGAEVEGECWTQGSAWSWTQQGEATAHVSGIFATFSVSHK